MERGTPKSFLSTDRSKMSFNSSPGYYDIELQLEKEYLDKLKVQRMKAQKLYNEYRSMLKERDKIKGEKEELRKELTEMKRNYERIAEDSRSELIKIKYSYEHLETEHRSFKSSHSQQQNVKLVHDKKVRELENQLQVYEQDRYNRMELVEYLQEEINRLEAERDKKNDETDMELDLLREKYLKSESSHQKLTKQVSLDREVAARTKLSWEQERQKMNESITTKLDDIRRLKIDFESQLTDKDRLYQIVVSELQENKMHWSVKIDQKSKEMHNYRRTIERSRDEIKKLKVQNQFLRERTREVEEDEKSYKQSLDDLSTSLSVKGTEYYELQSKHIKAVEQQHVLEMELHEMRAGVKEGEQTGRRLQENCEEYLKIIEKMERSEQKRTTIVETEYQEIERMERIFSQFE